MFQRILVPLDGSARAERAIPVAARLARAAGGTVILLRAPSAFAEIWPSNTPQADLAEIEYYLSTLRTTAELEGVATELLALAEPGVPAILRRVHASHADLIVMCSHGYTGMTRQVMGSVAEKVAHHARIPVLVLRESEPLLAEPRAGRERPLRALVALDGSALAQAALAPAAALVAALSAPSSGALHLVRVVGPDTEDRPSFSEAKCYLSETVGQLLKKGEMPGGVSPQITWSVATDTDVASALLRLAEQGEDAEEAGVSGSCDVIAMATHSLVGLRRWVTGSVTDRVLETARLPLLIVRAPDIADAYQIDWDEAMLTSLQEMS